MKRSFVTSVKQGLPFLLLLLLTGCESNAVTGKPVVEEEIPDIVRLPVKQPVAETPTTFEIHAPCAVYFSPTDKDITELKKYSNDAVTEENMWYTSESYNFFSSKGLPTLEAEEKTVRFHLINGELKEFSIDKQAQQWNIVLFDGKSTVSVIQAIDAEQAFERLFN